MDTPFQISKYATALQSAQSTVLPPKYSRSDQPTVSCANVWNNLPDDVTQVSSVSGFREYLRTFLFHRLYHRVDAMDIDSLILRPRYK